MKCDPGPSAAVGFQCKVCGSQMRPGESNECSGAPIHITAHAVDVNCCGGSAVIESIIQSPCQPVKISDCKEVGYERCVKCGYVFVPGEARERACDNPDSVRTNKISPGFFASAGKFIQAYAKFKASGCKTVSFPEILNRFRNCSSCNEYNDHLGKCCRCNCFVNLLHDGQGMNKLEWATEKCPLEQPKWEELV